MMGDTSMATNGLTLAAIAAVCTTFVALTFQLTDERIDANRQAWLEQSLQPVLAGVSFDSGISDSKLTVPSPSGLPGDGDAIIYRVYSGGTPAAALFVVSARDGYSGAIEMLVGVDANGAVTGVHVLAHRETPGLGDLVETGKSDWAMQFKGRSLGNPVSAGWAVRRDGGDFDQLTGATITPRAIVKAVRETLEYHAENQVLVFSAAGNPSPPEEVGR